MEKNYIGRALKLILDRLPSGSVGSGDVLSIGSSLIALVAFHFFQSSVFNALCAVVA